MIRNVCVDWFFELPVALTASTSMPPAVVTCPSNDKPAQIAVGKPSKTISFILQPVTTTETEFVSFALICPKLIEAVVDNVLKAPFPVPIAI